MAEDSLWKCSNCGYENSAYDTECFLCKHPNPAYGPKQSTKSEQWRKIRKASRRRASGRDQLSIVYYVVMVLLAVGLILFFNMTPIGRRLTSNIHVGLVLDFASTTFGEVSSNWGGFRNILIGIGCLIGLLGGIGGVIVGGICAYLLYVIICFIWVLLVSYVFPLVVNAGAFITVVALCIASALGSTVAIVNYVKKLFLYANPYPPKPGVYDDGVRHYYEDTHKHREEYGRRSYFFGPGVFSIKQTIKYSWIANFHLIGNVKDWLADHTHGIREWLLWIPGVPYFILYTLSILFVGSVVTIVCSLIHAIPMLIVMCIIDILFSITWLIDRVYLQIHSIKTSCPYDQVRAVVPAFQCPSCGNMHNYLVPGPYGIWHRRCTCGRRLPTTFLMGRSSLKAFCLKCGTELAASDVQQFSLTIVGGTSSGKTVLLSAFYHEFLKAIDRKENLTYIIPEIHQTMFDDLKAWFAGAECLATTTRDTSNMYSVLLRSSVFGVDKQFSLYDISGEAFEDSAMATMLPQRQMKDSDGIVIIIDPLSALVMRNDAESEGDDTSNFSKADAATIISNFVTYLKTVLTNSKLKNRSEKPVAVVITKSDLSSVSSRISYHHIKSIMREGGTRFASFADARDAVSRDFLIEIGLQDAVRSIEAAFSTVHYFPVSAIGHAANGEEYEPEHVVEPFYWLIRTAQPTFAQMLDIREE